MDMSFWGSLFSTALPVSLHILPGSFYSMLTNCETLISIWWYVFWYADVLKSKSVPENIYLYFIDYARAFDYVAYNKLWKILIKRWEYQTTWLAS